MNKTIAAAAALLLLFGCSDPQGTQPGEAVAPTAGDSAGGDSASKGDGGSSTAAPDDGPGKKDGGSKNGDGGDDGDPADEGGSRRTSPSGRVSDTTTDGSSGYMAAGQYVYDQEGFERFCNGPSCSKHPLPDTATIDASYASSSGSNATIVTESRSSEQQTVTTTTRHTAGAASITKVVIDFAYSGFSFSQTYEPKPAIESLAFPLEVGKSWRGRWKARTSGDYRMKVTGVSDGVYRIETVTNFKGDFSGRAQATVWVDGRTRAIVRTDGEIAVASGFGTYTSDFRTVLRSAPTS